MVVCKFFLQGNCRFGDQCRNEHPRSAGGGSGSGGFGNQNRFGALAGNSGSGGGNNNHQNENNYTAPTSDDIRNDLTEGKGRPKWILSSYGAGKNPPASLLQGNEYSPEEIRVRFYELADQGKQDLADQEAVGLWNKALHDIDNVKNNADDARKFVDAAGRKLPNRYSVVEGRENPPVPTQQSHFGTQTSTTFNPFGRQATSTFGQQSGPSPFSSNQSSSGVAFGTASQAGGGFGQQSGLGQSGLGKPSLSSGFGQPAFGSTGFGGQAQSNPFAPATASSGFGGAQTTQTTSTFGQPSQTTSAFSSNASPFGQTQPNSAFSKPSTAPAFGQQAFGQPSQPSSTLGQASQSTSTFGQPSQSSSTFGQPSQPTGVFGQPSQPTSTFQQPSQSAIAFGQPSQSSNALPQPSQPATALAQPSQQSSQGAFGTGVFGGSSSGASTIFGKPSTSTASPFGVKPPSQTFGSGTGVFGSNAGSVQPNPFGVKAASPLSNEADMGDSSTPTQPSSRDNPFAKPPTGPTASATSPQLATVGNSVTSPVAPISRTPREKTGKVPLVYAQTLPDVASQFDSRGKLVSFRGQRVVYAEDAVKKAEAEEIRARPEKKAKFEENALAEEKKARAERDRKKASELKAWSEELWSRANAIKIEPEPEYHYPCLRRADGTLEKIWFPQGDRESNVEALRKLDLQAQEEEYTDEVKEQYRVLHETGRFGVMPRVPPMRERVGYDF